MKKTHRPVKRKFWNYLKYLPAFLRAPFLRSQFKIAAELPESIVLKQAETEDEINAALEIVYESYLKLNYIDSNAARKRLTKFHLLPTTVILIIKLKEEVIGTISIVLDSAMKLPSDTTWDLSRFRKNGAQIAEISSLCIKRSEFRRGNLLLPLCKLMYLYCKNFLKVDGIIVSTTLEVEAFYTDLLLFEKIGLRMGQGHRMVKNNPSTCCYLSLGHGAAEANYKRVYAGKSDQHNLYKFFVETNTPNIQLPEQKYCLQSYTHKQYKSISKIVSRWPDSLQAVTSHERQIISNLDLVKNFKFCDSKTAMANLRKDRFETRQQIKCLNTNGSEAIDATLINLSERGFKILLPKNHRLSNDSKTIEIQINFDNKQLVVQGAVMWCDGSLLGCEIRNNFRKWENFVSRIHQEFQAQAA